MDAGKIKKLQDYASFLVRQAESKESQGNKLDAARDYVKLVDIYLLLANETKDHPTWQQIIGRVEYYQKKVRLLGGPDSSAFHSASNQAPLLRKQEPEDYLGKAAPRQPESSSTMKPQVTSSSFLKSFKKIPGLIGKSNQGQSSLETKPPIKAEVIPIDQIPQNTLSDPITSWVNELPAPRSMDALESKVQEERTNHSQLVLENTVLKERVESLERIESEHLADSEAIRKEMAGKMAQMVSRKDYDDIKSRLSDSIPKSEYEKLAKSLEEMVPKERLKDAEKYISDLETRLQNSISRSVLDQLAEYTRIMISTSSIDLVDVIGEESESPATAQSPKGTRGQQFGQKVMLDVMPPAWPERNGAAEPKMSPSKVVQLEIRMKPQRNIPRQINGQNAIDEESGKVEIGEVQSNLAEIHGNIATRKGPKEEPNQEDGYVVFTKALEYEGS